MCVFFGQKQKFTYYPKYFFDHANSNAFPLPPQKKTKQKNQKRKKKKKNTHQNLQPFFLNITLTSPGPGPSKCETLGSQKKYQNWWLNSAGGPIF